MFPVLPQLHRQEGMIRMAFDVYSVIRSEEVRDHARKYWNLRPEDKVLLIHFSFFPIEKRYELLKEFADSLNEEDAKRYAEDFARVYRMVVDHIYHPEERVLYLCEMARPSATEYRPEEEPARNVFDVSGYNFRGWYDSLEELMESEVSAEEPMEPGYLISVYEVSLPDSGKSDDKVRFYIESIDGRNGISRFYADDNWLRESGISESVIDDLFYGGNGGRHSYPFANFGSVLIQTPLMEKPLKCTINSELDGNYCWYQWLHPRLQEIPEYPGWKDISDLDKGWQMDLSYWLANLTGHYSTFDWIRSDPEANDCFPDDYERICRGWENIRHMICWRNEEPEENEIASNASSMLWPSRMEEINIKGETVKTLWLNLDKSLDGASSEEKPDAASVADLLRISFEKTAAFEDAIMRICHVQCKVRIQSYSLSRRKTIL
jgi:hypothetical protein